MSEPEKPYTVIVGVSATSKSPTALVWGKAQADANGGRLIAVRVHPQPHSLQGSPGSSSRGATELNELRDQQRAELERDVVDVLGAHHGAEVRVVHGSKRRCLINESHEADVLVIDAPRAPSMSPLLAQRIVYAATCPVVVMPPSISGLPESSLSRSARAVGRAAPRSAGTSGRAGYRPPINPDA
jgi:nucleotide-binding universal stress UspA family protein